MSAQHTPGPWAWQGDLYKELVSLSNPKIGPNGAAQYTVVIDDGSAAGEYSQMIDPDGPDARLIAAAPDLLEALSGLIEAHAVPSNICKERPAYETACAAIAKALGEKHAPTADYIKTLRDALETSAQQAKRVPMTDAEAHKTLLDMAAHIEKFGDGTESNEQLSSECIRLILGRVDHRGITPAEKPTDWSAA